MIDSRELDNPRENVIWAYNHILQREPESQKHIDGWVILNLPFIEIARLFVESIEFQNLYPEQKTAAFARLRRRLELKPQDDIRRFLSRTGSAPPTD